jgi:predicted phosphodiesterase
MGLSWAQTVSDEALGGALAEGLVWVAVERAEDLRGSPVSYDALDRACRRHLGKGAKELATPSAAGAPETPEGGTWLDVPISDLKLPKEPRTQAPSRPTVWWKGPKPRFTLVPGDIHIPCHDEPAIQAMLDLARDVGVDHVVLQGDTFDTYSLSSYGHEVERVLGRSYTVAQEAAEGQWLHKALLAQAKRVDFIPGNHEFRAKRTIDLNPGLFGHEAVSIRKLFDLPEEYVVHDWRSRLRMGSVCIEHGDQLKGTLTQYGAAKVLRDYPDQTTFYGHTHRIDVHRHTSYKDGSPTPRMAASIGHLSRLECHTYVSDPTWQQGFLLIEWWGPERKRFTPHIIEVIDGQFSFAGKVYG